MLNPDIVLPSYISNVSFPSDGVEEELSRLPFYVRLPIEHIDGASIPALLFPTGNVVFLESLKTIEERSPTDFEDPGNIGGRMAFIHEPPSLANLLLVHRIPTPHFLPSTLSGLNAFTGPFLNQLPLEFGQGSKDMTDQASGGRPGFDALSDGSELNPPTGEVIEDGDQVTERAAEAV